MKIPSIKYLKNYINIFQYNKNTTSTTPALLEDINLKKIALERISSEDTFQKQNYRQVLEGIENDYYKEIRAVSLLKSKPINEKTYSEMSPDVIQTLRAQLNSDFLDDAKTLITAARLIKMLFDNKYGENQYTFISIGRSLSALANCLGFMGVETKQIPLSGCGATGRIGESKILDMMTSQEGFKEYKNFLTETLNPEDNKKHIFCDYGFTGQTLRVFEEFLNHPKVELGQEKDDFVKINNFLKDSLKNISKEYTKFIKKFNRMLKLQHFDEYAEIKSLYFTEIGKINSALDSKDLIRNKLMKFCFIDMFNAAK